jgi:hypothetical protein
MPHLVERHDHLLAFDFGRRQLARFVSDPAEHGHVGNSEQTGDRTKTHIAHGVKQRRQRFHRRWLAARRRHGEIASAGVAMIALKSADNAVLPEVLRAAALAANLRHGGGPFPIAAIGLQRKWLTLS